MIVDLALEQLTFSCRRCGHRWRADYDVAQYENEDGDVFEYFALDGQPVPSPYPPGSVTCPRCQQPATFGRLAARREIPVPPGNPSRPRTLLKDPVATLSERRETPTLAATHTSSQPAREAAGSAPQSHFEPAP